MNRGRQFLGLVTSLLLLFGGATKASAEGSAQISVPQRLVTDTVLRVDVYEIGEVIHIAARNSEAAPLAVHVFAPSGTETHVPLVSGAGELASDVVPAMICDAARVTALETGVYRLRFEADGTMPVWQRTVSPFDVTVAPAAISCVSPFDAGGRLHSLDFHLRAASFDRSESTNADFFVLATNLARTTNSVWLLDFEGLAGWDYHVLASSAGLAAPYAYTSVFTALTPQPSATPEYPIYLAPPGQVGPPPPPPTITVTPFTGVHTGIAGVGVDLEFFSNVLGTFQMVVDVNADGRYEPTQGDASFSAAVQIGTNRFSVPGAFAAGTALTASNTPYTARLSLRTGEFHFAGFDIETARPGLAVLEYDVEAKQARPTMMHWDDRRVLSGDPTRDPSPTYALAPGVMSDQGRHGWGDYTARAPGDAAYIDTWVFRAEAVLDVPLPWLPATDDPDADLLDNARERELGTRYDVADTDGDGKLDGQEAPQTGPAPDTNHNGIADVLEPDSSPQSIGPAVQTPAPQPQPSLPDAGTAPPQARGADAAPAPDAANSGNEPDALPYPASDGSVDAGVSAPALDAGSKARPHAATPSYEPRFAPVGGAACSVFTLANGRPSPVAWLFFVPWILVRWRFRRRLQQHGQFVLLCAFLCSLPQTTRADNAVRLDQYRPAETAHDGFVTRRASMPGETLGTRLDVAYAWRPLVMESVDATGRHEPISLIRRELGLTIQQSYAAFDRMLLSFALHGVAVQQGTRVAGLPAAGGAGLGDLALAARISAWGREHTGPLHLALHTSSILPAARWADSSQRLRGESAVSFESSALAELAFGDVVLVGNFGVRLRRPAQLGPLSLGHELPYSIAMLVPINRVLSLHAELFGARPLGAAVRGSAPCDALAGARATLGAWTLGAAAGPGLASGYGSPDGRVVLQLAYGMPQEKLVERDVDRDGDTVWDRFDRCAATPEDADNFEDGDGCPELDNDRDGVPDTSDGAPLKPEDHDGFEDNDGVPDPDNDRDQIPDVRDREPNIAEDSDGFEDEDGAPEPDNDQDGVPDVRDGAPNDPEDRDGFSDHDGVPDPDNDLDGLLDAYDECPLAPGLEPDHGCPRLIRYADGQPQIVLMARVEFETDRDVILDKSVSLLEEVRAALAANPQLTRVRVEGHTDSQRGDVYNLDLSRRRAATVRTWLIGHGIPAERLEAYGCGLRRPIDDNQTRDGRQRNRRVEFHIVAPAPQYGARSASGCIEQAP